MDTSDRMLAAALTLDGAGSVCADLTPNIKRAIVALAPGEILEVSTDDHAARVGVPAWCRLTGHQLVNVVELDEHRTRFFIKHK